MITYHQHCRVCKNSLDQNPVVDLGYHFLHGSFVYNDTTLSKRKTPVHLLFCNPRDGGCGLLQLSTSLDPAILYNQYGYRSSINEKMTVHLSNLVKNIISHPKLKINKVLDIGQNDGFLLSCYADSVQKVGVDPCDAGLKSNIKISNHTFINECYPSELLQSEKFDVITCIAMFYDLNNPVFVAKKIKENLNTNGVAIIEVSYWPDKMAKNAIDECCQEHVCYYSLTTLEQVFKKAGLCIFNVFKNDINGGSIQVWLTHKENNPFYNKENQQKINAIKIQEFNAQLDDYLTYLLFSNKIHSEKQKIQEFFNSNKNKKIHLYGASTKSNVAIQFWGLNNSQIQYAAERNIDKIGARTLGTNIPIISEQESRNLKPNYYFCLIWGFMKEVLLREKDYIMNGGAFVFPIPALKIITKDNYENALKDL